MHLTEEGRTQGRALAQHAEFPAVAAVYCSPLERARETAQFIATRWNLVPRMEPDLSEIDYGEWTGRLIADLAPNPHWHAFNMSRALVIPPAGESMAAVQARALAACARIATQHQNSNVAVVTHGDVIRAILCAHAGISLDRIFEFTVDYASVHNVPGTGSPVIESC